MNIEKLAKHLKEFTLDEIEMIAECDCRIELERLLEEGKLVFKQGIYKIKEEKIKENFELFIIPKNKIIPIKFETAVKYFMKNYVEKYCKYETYKNYNSIFKFNILPYLKKKYLNDIGINEVKEVYINCNQRSLQPRRIKNTMALLNQLIKYFQNFGLIDKTCNFKVKRLTDKNKFNLDNIIFKFN